MHPLRKLREPGHAAPAQVSALLAEAAGLHHLGRDVSQLRLNHPVRQSARRVKAGCAILNSPVAARRANLIRDARMRSRAI